MKYRFQSLSVGEKFNYNNIEYIRLSHFRAKNVKTNEIVVLKKSYQVEVKNKIWG